MAGFRSRRPEPRFPPAPAPDDPVSLSRLAVRAALENGFDAAGVVAATRPESFPRFRSWLDAGLHGEMTWLERDARARESFDSILPHARAVLAVARAVAPGGDGNVARYARGEDYHAAVRRDLKKVVSQLAGQAPPGSHFRVCVDTAPLLERELAMRAGLGFLGKSGLLIVPGVGSHVVLGEVLTDVALAPSAVSVDPTWERCGSCSRCLEACPTSAFLGPRWLDARRCLSYLTIEKRGPLAPEEEQALEGRLFGCDVCQDVCPWNGDGPWAPSAGGEGAWLDPAPLAGIDDAAFEERFGKSAIRRATAAGLARNARAALALGAVP